MATTSRALLFFGSVLLIHACYSAHEHSSLLALSNFSAPTSSKATASQATPSDTPYSSFSRPSTSGPSSLPLDITIETIVSVVLLCVALVSGSEELKPISWRVWAGKVQAKGGSGHEGEGFAWLDAGQRAGFVDIRGQRKAFAEWAKGKGGN